MKYQIIFEDVLFDKDIVKIPNSIIDLSIDKCVH